MKRLPPHVHAACVALGILAVGFSALLAGTHWIEHRAIHTFASQTSSIKNQGTVLQHATFEEPDLLPLYGSSELLKGVPDKASTFFAKYPTQFAVSPIGKPGCTSIIMLQKIGAAAMTHQGNKMAVILSPSWFLVKTPNRHGYIGNFSALQCSHLMFRSDLSWELKRDIARRLVDYPQTLENSSFLETAVRHAASGTPMDRLELAAMRPLAWLQNALGDLQDHVASAIAIYRGQYRLKSDSITPTDIASWRDLIRSSDKMVKMPVDGKPDPRPRYFANDGEFLQAMDHAEEWGDLELLLRVLRELHLDPLVITIPIERHHFEEMGVSPAAIDAYEQRLSALATEYHVPFAAFADHGDDGKFFADHHDHLSAKGWMYFDKTLNDFYHAPRRHFRPKRLHIDDSHEQSRG